LRVVGCQEIRGVKQGARSRRASKAAQLVNRDKPTMEGGK